MENILSLASHGLGIPDYAQTLIRVGVGSFFAISGYHKLFNKQRHETLVSTLKDCGIPEYLHLGHMTFPCIKYMQWFVPGVEYFGGIAVAAGIFAPVFATMLMAICLVAICTDGLKRVAQWKPLDKADYVDDVEYLPEYTYLLLLIMIVAGGPGALSLI